ncbi:hypothetical protein Nepgr_031897 [Nepenthes gracilis]|uniref:Uncharacterized protein n=1 Tax=Nepenthes gracilis TaxID=150966 RepID=A0AAD3TIZ7_NEPGR|nr:hypothetical protein Nepgr_031897 [Nepenthes gracilis]
MRMMCIPSTTGKAEKKGNGNETKIVKSVRNQLDNEESNGRGEEGKAVNLKKNQITIVEDEAGNTKIKKGKEISRHEGIGSKKRKTKKLVGNESSSFGAGYFHETHVDAEVMEKSELTESKNKKKKKKGDLGAAQEHEDFENIYDDVHSVSHSENNKGLSKIKKKTKSSRNDAGKAADRQVLEVINTDEAFNPYENSAPEKKLKKVRFSGSVEVYPISNSSTEMGRTLEDGLIRGKRFSSEEDEMVRKAVLNYIEVHSLGDEGLKMVLNCKSHLEVRRCWKEIGASLPWRPHMSVYYRAHILFERGESRKWTPKSWNLSNSSMKSTEQNGKPLLKNLVNIGFM